MTEQALELQQRAHADLTNRARGGIVIYLLAWLCIMMPTGIHISNAGFFYVNTAILTLIMFSRLAHYFCQTRNPELPVKLLNDWLVYTILAGSLHWGLMSAWCLTQDAYQVLHVYLIVTSAVLGLAGPTALSISGRIRVLFPLLTMAPMILVLLVRASTQDLIFAAMAILALVYVSVTSRTANQDYWQAIKNRALAEQRALAMEKLSITDQLTQLKNRSYFDQRFAEEWKRGDRQDSALSLLMLDLDHFKQLNDTHGHVFGDQCLQRVAQVLESGIHRETDIVARYGGEEFVILMPDTDAVEAAAVAEKLRLAVAEIELENDGRQVGMTCSIGGASAQPDHHQNRELLLKRADQALYTAKRNGRNQYCASPSSELKAAGAL